MQEHAGLDEQANVEPHPVVEIRVPADGLAVEWLPADEDVEGKILKAIADFDMFRVEIDSYSPAALGYIRRQSPHPISSCETLLGLREFLPYFREQAMGVAIIDAVWNGVWQAMKIAGAAEAFEVNIAPHNFYGHLATMMNAHFAAAVPNLRIMEVDIDRLPRDEKVFTAVPQFENGHLLAPATPGWGTEPIEEAIKAHPTRAPGGLLHYRQS
jgi:galactonate dehydratase